MAPPPEHLGWRHFVLGVLGMHEAGKPSHRVESIRPLSFRWSQGSPCDCGARDDIGFPTPARKAGELAEIAFDGGQGEAGGTADGEIRVNSVHQHGITSGHGLATSCSKSTSTLA